MKQLAILFTLTLLTNISYAQKGSNYTVHYGGDGEEIEYDIEKTITLNGESETKTFDFVISEDSKELFFQAEGSVSGGTLRVSLIDPKGKKHPGFKLQASKEGKAKGIVTEVNDEIIVGKWKVEVKNKNASGEVSIKVGQS